MGERERDEDNATPSDDSAPAPAADANADEAPAAVDHDAPGETASQAGDAAAGVTDAMPAIDATLEATTPAPAAVPPSDGVAEPADAHEPAGNPEGLVDEITGDFDAGTRGDAGDLAEPAAAVVTDSQAADDLADSPVATLRTDHIVDDEAIADAEAPLVGSAELKAIVEALIFASPEPLSLSAIAKLLDGESKDDVGTAVAALRTDYERPGGLQLVEVAGGFQIVTRPDLNDWVRRLFHERSTQKLSVQALETLAVIAYRQPITAAEVAEIRGVNTSGVLNTLLERHLVKIVGRKAVVGRPFMYSTTKEFLIRFGLNEINDLPKVQDMVDALGLESPLLVERMTAEEQLPLEEPDADAESVGSDEPRD